MSSILAIGAHPDDIEFGCGATLAKFVANGHKVFALVLTRGESGGDPHVREQEQQKSAACIGLEDVFWGNFTDTRLPFYDNVIQVIEKTVKVAEPTFILVHHGRDTHQDHRYTSSCAVAASRNVPNVLFYEGPTSFGFDPNVYVNVAGFLEPKFEGLACHSSQVLRTNIDNRAIVDIARATATFRGTQCRVQHAEAFISLRMMFNL